MESSTSSTLSTPVRRSTSTVGNGCRKQLERLARYITRPPIAQERLTQRPDGILLLEFKKAWKDGSRALVLTPEDLLVRLCAAVPPPRFHMVRYFGVLSSYSRSARVSCQSRSKMPWRADRHQRKVTNSSC